MRFIDNFFALIDSLIGMNSRFYLFFLGAIALFFLANLPPFSFAPISFASISLASTTTISILPQVSFIGQSILPTTLTCQNTPVGGLSDLTYDSKTDLYYAISDDRSQHSPARFYTMAADLNQGMLTLGRVTPVTVTTLLDKDDKPFPPFSLDPESIALTRDRTLLIASEGDTNQGIPPFVREFALTGHAIRSLPIPEKFRPHPQEQRGIRNNLAFESLTLTPDQQFLFVATENALLQDGPTATPAQGSRSRILQYDFRSGQPQAEYLYLTEPVTVSRFSHSDGVNGLVELVALDDRGHFLSLERSFSLPAGVTIKLFFVSLAEATDISQIDSLVHLDRQVRDRIQPVRKTLLLDFKTLNLRLDNIEGLTLGPDLPNGSRSLIAISDNNFSPLQSTQILAFSLSLPDK